MFAGIVQGFEQSLLGTRVVEALQYENAVLAHLRIAVGQECRGSPPGCGPEVAELREVDAAGGDILGVGELVSPVTSAQRVSIKQRTSANEHRYRDQKQWQERTAT